MGKDEYTAAVQGFGNVGSITAKFLHEQGVKVVGVSDVHGAIYNADGIDVPKLLQYANDRRTIVGFDNCDSMDPSDIFELDVDILVPAAVANCITEKNADSVKAKIIAEGANGPVTTEADTILHDKGAFVIPGILANAGGVVVSYFEWVQGLQHLFWSENEVVERLNFLMSKSFNEVFELTQAKKVDPRTAAMMIGVGRVAEAKLLRGLYP